MSSSTPREIPGYYYDWDKKKYFKIERGATAPSTAAWSERNVRKRKAEAEQAAAARRRADIEATQVQQSRLLADPVVGGLLRRELHGGRASPSERCALDDLPQTTWVLGLEDKGAVSFRDDGGPAAAPARGRVADFLAIGGESRLGLGLLFAVYNSDVSISPPVYSTYFQRDQYDHIQAGPRSINAAQSRYCGMHIEGHCMVKNPTTMTYDPGTESIIITTDGSASHLVRICRLWPSSDPGTPRWALGAAKHIVQCAPQRHTPPIRALALAPQSSSGPYAALGTDEGVFTLDLGGSGGGGRNNDATLTCVAPSLPPKADFGGRGKGKGVNHKRSQKQPPLPAVPSGEVFALDFIASHPQVLVAGGRGPAGICVTDLRERPRPPPPGVGWADARVDGGGGGWASARRRELNGARGRKVVYFWEGRHQNNNISSSSSGGVGKGVGGHLQDVLLCHPGYHNPLHKEILFPEGVATSGAPGGRSWRWLQVARERVVNHLVSLNTFQVLSSGIEGRMHVWDLRRGFGQPYTTFHGYKNKAIVSAADRGMGLAVEKTLGIVAAANDDGTVGLHSLRSGAELPCPPALAAVCPPLSASPSPSSSPSPRLQWETLPGDRAPSLFVAAGSEVRKLSFGVDSRLRGDEFSMG